MTEVRLEMAWTWLCPNCAARNFTASCAKAEMTPEERETAIREAFRIQPWEDMPSEEGEFVTQPEKVVCNKCRTMFATAEEEAC